MPPARPPGPADRASPSTAVPRRARRLGAAATTLGAAHAAITVLWVLGSTWLLDTVGGTLAEWGRERTPAAVGLLVAVAIVKVAVACAAAWFAGAGRGPLARRARTRAGRAAGWAAAATLTAYGTTLAVAGALVVNDVVDVGRVDDPVALRWHAYLWDPWFALWGIALGGTLWLTRPAGARRGGRRHPPPGDAQATAPAPARAGGRPPG